MNEPLKTLDLFAGIGGVRLGFEKEGFNTVMAIDNDKHCKVTYDANFSSSPLTLADIRDVIPNQLPQFDVLLAGFPCTPFSVAGYKKGFEDESNGDLFFRTLKILKARHPQAFFLENVKHLLKHDNGKTFAVVRKRLEAAGYHVHVGIMNSAQYGNTPQNRERIYIVGFAERSAYDAFKFPAPIPLTKSVVHLLEKEVDERYYYREGTWLFEKIKGTDFEKGRIYLWRRTYLRKSVSGLSFTLTANMGGGGHNVPLIRDKKGIRRLTPRECARLQGFDESYKLPETVRDTQLYRQFGNSVTVSVVRRIAARIKKAVQNGGGNSTSRIAKKTNTHGRGIQQKAAQRNRASDPLPEYAH